jgi:dGTPase
MDDAEELVGRLFGHYETAAGERPADWLAGLSPSDATGRAVRIVDFIAGMTDRYAMVEHSRIFGATPELM